MARAEDERQGGRDVRAVRRGRRIRRFLAGTLAALALVLLGSHLAVDRVTRLFFVPTREHVSSPAEAGLPYDAYTIPAADGAPLEAWWFPSRLPEGGKAAALVVHAHGNGGNLSNHWPLATGLTQRGFEVLAFDYRGYGNSPGRVTRRSAVQDLRTVLDHAKARARREGLPLVLLGQSMGAALALEVAPERDDLAAVVVDSPFSSWPGVASRHAADGRWYGGLVRAALETLFWSSEEPVESAERIRVPLLVVTGTKDSTCPTEMAQEIARRAPNAELYVLEGAEHVGMRKAIESACMFDEVARFMREAVGRDGASS